MNRDPLKELERFYVDLAKAPVPELKSRGSRFQAWTVPAGLGLGLAATLAIVLWASSGAVSDGEVDQASRSFLRRQLQAAGETPHPLKGDAKKWPSEV